MNSSTRISLVALILAAGAFALAAAGWQQARRAVVEHAEVTAPATEWLRGNAEERFATVEKQFRGLDVAMAEIGYRFTELYFAGKDGNWDYAKYQREKIDLALRLALVRRPKRAKSAQPFLDEALPAVQRATDARDAQQFARTMDRLRTACMKCHADEQVPYFTVELPERRITSIRATR